MPEQAFHKHYHSVLLCNFTLFIIKPISADQSVPNRKHPWQVCVTSAAELQFPSNTQSFWKSFIN